MGNIEGMMIDVLNYWLETDPKKSRTKLAEAVEDCGYGVVADKIRSVKDKPGKFKYIRYNYYFIMIVFL